jgi:hypothetical protein
MHRGMHRGMRIPDTNAPRNARRFTLDDPVVEVELDGTRARRALYLSHAWPLAPPPWRWFDSRRKAVRWLISQCTLEACDLLRDICMRP